MNKEKQMLLHLLMEKYRCLLEESEVCCPDIYACPPSVEEEVWGEWETYTSLNWEETPPEPGSLSSIAYILFLIPGVEKIRYRKTNINKIQFEVTGGLPLDIADTILGSKPEDKVAVGSTTVQTSYGPSVSFNYIPVEGE